MPERSLATDRGDVSSDIAEPAGLSAVRLAEIIEDFARELHPERAQALRVRPDSSLERDLGIDSLARVELILRLEREFGVRPAQDAVMEAETPTDLLHALATAGPAAAPEPKWIVPEPELTTAAPEEAETLLEVLAFHVAAHPDRPHIRLLEASDEEQVISYGDLWRGAQGVASGLGEQDLAHGAAVGIMLPTSADFFHAFFGVLLAGGVPVPIYPPLRRTQIAEHLRRQAGILRNAEVPTLITTAQARPFDRIIRAQVPSLKAIVTAGDLQKFANGELRPQIGAEGLALVQYTSGSTGDPKGVMLSHARLLTNIRGLAQVFQVTSQDVVVSWLPLYHDMGLIGTWLGSLVYACPFVVMPPLAFLARPERWLWAIHRYRGTLSAAPNFAYELCLRKINDRDIEGLDLSSWRMAGNGAERVSRATVTRFSQRFSKFGFQPQALTPMYGLAESSVALTTSPLGRGPRFDRVARRALASEARAIPAERDDPQAVDFASCGIPLPRHEVRIVDTAGRELGDRQEGLLQFRGPSATLGYLRAPQETAKLMRDGWLNTGDTGYIAAGELYVTGRVKDIIVRAGRNLYPDELEDAVGDLEGARKGRVAVFAVEDPTAGTERMVVLAETRLQGSGERDDLRGRIVQLVVDLASIPPDEVVLAPPRTVLKTDNGKVRRSACRALYETGGIGRPPPAFWQQFLGLVRASAKPQIRRWKQALSAGFYAVAFQAIYRLMSPFVFFCVVAFPNLRARRWAFRFVARVMLRLLCIAPVVRGLEHISVERSYILVTNHASFLDGLVLTAVLPLTFAFVAKRELVKSPVGGPFLRRLGTAFVERFDPAGGVEDTQRLIKSLGTGESLVMFAEGTFDRRPGLRPFHMGAFVAASETGVPILPVGISGTRAILRGDSNFARWGQISVSFGPAIEAQGADWAAALALRDQARAAVLVLCGEPDLISEPTQIPQPG